MDSKWKIVQGKIPTKRELADWKPDHYIHFLRFCEHFIVQKEDGHLIVSVTKERWRSAEQILAMPDHPFQEFLYRINRFTFQPDASEKKFNFKFGSMMRFVLGYLRDNPILISDEMRKIIEPNEKLNWCLKTTTITQTPMGPILTPNEMGGSIAPLEQRLMESVNKAINLFDLLTGSIDAEELKKMSVKDKLAAVARLAPFLNSAKNFKPGKQIFKQINIHTSDRETLESALLAVAKDD